MPHTTQDVSVPSSSSNHGELAALLHAALVDNTVPVCTTRAPSHCTLSPTEDHAEQVEPKQTIVDVGIP